MKRRLFTLLLIVYANSATILPSLVSETDGVVEVIYTLDTPTTGFTRWNYQIVDGTAINGIDFTANVTGRLWFIKNRTTPIRNIEITLIDNTLCTGDRTFNIVIDQNTYIVTITDDDCGTMVPDTSKVYEQETVQIVPNFN